MREESDVLDGIADAAAQLRRFPLGDRLALDAHFAGGRVEQTVDQLERGGFAGAAAAQSINVSPRLHCEVQGTQETACRRAGEARVVELDHGLGGIHW